MTIMMDSFV